MNEDDRIMKLFSDFQPELSSDEGFIANLTKKMEVVEILKKHNLYLKRRNRLAVALAAISGALVGTVLTLLFPILSAWESQLIGNLDFFRSHIDSGIVTWILMGCGCILTSTSVYEIMSPAVFPAVLRGRDLLPE